MTSKAKEEVIDLVKVSLNDYENKDNLKLRSIVIGKLLEKNKLYNFQAKLNNLKYTYSQKGNNYSILVKVLGNIYENYSVEDIAFEIFIVELNKWFLEIKNKDLIPYTVIFPINLNFRETLPVKFITHSRDIKIKLVSSHEYRAKYYGEIFKYINTEYNEIADKRKIGIIRRVGDSSYSYFVLEIHGRNLYYAIKKGSETVGINSGIFCFIKYAYRTFLRIGGDPFRHSISKVDTPVVFVFKKDNSNLNLENILFSKYKIPTRAKEMRRDKVELFLSVLDSITSIQNRKLRKISVDAFMSYYDAIREEKLAFTFLKFWNIMESLLLNDPELKEATFIKRMKAMYTEDLDTLRSQKIMVDILYSKRNMLVHESIDTIDKYDRDFIKINAEFMMEYFLNITQEIKSIGMLNFFYDNINRPIDILDNEMKVLDYIKENKSDNSTR